MSRRPYFLTVESISAFTWVSSETSVGTNVASPPACSISFVTACPLGGLISATTTRAPSRPKRSATARPSPAPPPVTTATFSFSHINHHVGVADYRTPHRLDTPISRLTKVDHHGLEPEAAGSNRHITKPQGKL